MCSEINILLKILLSLEMNKQFIPTRHLITPDYKAIVPDDAYLDSSGAFCDNFKFWYYISWSDEICGQMLKRKKD